MTPQALPTGADALPPCAHAAHRCPLQCLLPPYVLDAMIGRGNQRVREFALDALHTDHSFRAARMALLERRTQLRRDRPAARAARRRRMRRGLGAPFVDRAIYTAGGTQRLPGQLVRSEGQKPTGDPAVDQAYDWLGATWDMYYQAFDRNSLNGDGLRLDASVHFGQDYDNAFWDGKRMVFGDGDGDVFQSFTASLDVVGHELTHGVTEDEAGLIYWGQPGALNESISDVFGSLVKQFYLRQPAEKADWLIGAELFVPGAVKGVALRSLRAPGTAYGYPDPDPVLGRDPQPAHMRDYVQTLQDNGGVHINSGIPNHAFYLAATKLGGYAWERAGKVWYTTLLSPLLRPMANFRTFARLTLLVSGRLFGAGSGEQSAVREAWNQVGIDV